MSVQDGAAAEIDDRASHCAGTSSSAFALPFCLDRQHETVFSWTDSASSGPGDGRMTPTMRPFPHLLAEKADNQVG